MWELPESAALPRVPQMVLRFLGILRKRKFPDSAEQKYALAVYTHHVVLENDR